MKLTDLLLVTAPAIRAEECKLHLATWNGHDSPLDVFLAGEFETWQSQQTRRNFQRKYVVALIDLPEKDRWLFAGVFEVLACSVERDDENCFRYQTRELAEFKEYSGRVVIGFEKRFRQPYPNFETVADELGIAEIKPEKVAVSAFPGFNSVLISHRVLQSIVRTGIESWRSVLSNVKGVYCITDRSNGKVYIGSATGEDMIWQRWMDYAQTGHGGNRQLQEIMNANGPEYARNYQYSILEIADSHASDNDVLKRESHWKDVLCSREYGYNSN